MKNPTVKLVMMLGAVIGVIGLGVGLWPQRTALGATCGSTWSPSPSFTVSALHDCQQAWGNPAVAAVLTILGLVIIVAALLTGALVASSSDNRSQA